MDKLDIEINLDASGIDVSEVVRMRKDALSFLDKIWKKDYVGSGWIDFPLRMSKSQIEEIENAAVYVQGICKKMIVIGIGGSFLGAKAGIEALMPQIEKARNSMVENYPFVDVVFAGNNLSAFALSKFVKMVQDEDVMLCVISKSGETLEVKVAFSILLAELAERFGPKEAAKRIIIITNSNDGTLRKLAKEKQYITLDIPADIGGRYSVLTSVGLLPMAVMGLDIKQILAGAVAAAGSPRWDTDALDYAIARNIYRKQGKRLEVFEVYEPQLYSLTLWLMQLFGESEGKSENAIYPANLELTRDLHSMGQYLQEGANIFFETVIDAPNQNIDLEIPETFFENFSVCSVKKLNEIAQKAAINAHKEANRPVLKIAVSEISEYTLGELFYFFETSCAVSALFQGVNPFNQPGVENYKNEICKLLR
ncbi:MAG: glucose-6-phosphate isomerase [Candidatus Fimenecus sp.]